jgi:hypothetical protein
MAVLDSFQEVVGSVINSLDDVGISFSISSPEDDNLIKTVCGLEIAIEVRMLPFTYANKSTHRISRRICSTCFMDALEPGMRLSARSSWLAAMKSG